MRQRIQHETRASTLIATMLVIGGLAIAIATYYQGLIPKYRGTHQGAAWHEALHGADAGADVAVNTLNTWALTTTDPTAYPWAASGWTFTDAGFMTNGERKLSAASLPSLGGPSNVQVTSLSVDVYTREASGSPPTYNPWFRVRSTARANLPGRFVASDSRDTELRRMKLGATTAGGAPDPHVTRTVEVILRPRYRAARAITSVSDMVLGNSANWRVDSFDSGDATKSNPGTAAGGVYPGSGSPKVQTNGNVASAKQNPAATPYGPLISGNGAIVKGEVKTNGGDDPATVAKENVSGSGGMDQNRILSDFDEDIPIPTAPVWSSWTYQGASRATFATGTQASPTRYAIIGNQGSFSVTAPATGTGYVEIIVAGNLSTGNGGGAGITIPPNVYATIWVQGNIDFGNGNINSNAASSRVASRLTVHGVSVSPAATFTASGNANQVLAFNGPNYAATLNGTVETTGSFVVKSFRINGGGNGGFHYDEALGRNAPIVGWDVASYFEDTRGDL
ncbi:MAG: hypothetical protein ABMA01_11845 [Chthoniobacteraceae bacterium]